MPEITVPYMVPVDVVVNTDERRVTRVVILDEEVMPATQVLDADDVGAQVTDANTLPLADEALVKAAREIAADADVSWPEWDRSY